MKKRVGTFYVKAEGQVFADSDRYGVFMDGDGELRDIERRPKYGYDDLYDAAARYLEGDADELDGFVERLKILSTQETVKRIKVHPFAWEGWRWRMSICDYRASGDELAMWLSEATSKTGEYLTKKHEGLCGTKTTEYSGVSLKSGEQRTSFSRYRCQDWRCRHCAKTYHRPRVMKRLETGVEALRQAGRWPWFLTLTLSDETWERAGIAHWSWQAKCAAGWLLIRKQWARFKERHLPAHGYRGDFPVATKLEVQQNGMVHLHAVCGFATLESDDDEQFKPYGRGKKKRQIQDWGAAALAEAKSRGCATIDDVLKDVARRRASRSGRHICFTKARSGLKKAAIAAGFGRVVDIRPWDPETGDHEDGGLWSYFAKDVRYARQDRLNGTGPSLPKEMAKLGQLPAFSIPAFANVVSWSRDWPTNYAGGEHEDPLDPSTTTFALHSETPERLREMADLRAEIDRAMGVE